MRVLMLAIVSLGLLSSAETKPDFTGSWKLDLAKSDFGKSPPPSSMTSRIEHHDPDLKVHSEIVGPQGSYATDYTWITDGRENVNTIRGNEIRAIVTWDGNVLVSSAKTTANGVALALVDRWTLSDDGHLLTIARTIYAPQGQAEQTFAYEK